MYLEVEVNWQLAPGPEGWTTFSVPVRPAASQKIFGDIINPADAEIAYKYDAANQMWVQVTNDSIAPLEAMYVKLKNPTLAKVCAVIGAEQVKGEIPAGRERLIAGSGKI